MRINGIPFTVSTVRHSSMSRLREAAGNCALLPEFRPIRFPHNTHIWRLLYNGFFSQGICCFLTGPFVLYMAGVFDSFTHASLFIALSDSPLIRCIFRRVPDPPSRFYIHNYLFEFTHGGGNEDILTLRRLMSYIYIYIYIYIYGAPILDVSRSHTTTQHSR